MNMEVRRIRGLSSEEKKSQEKKRDVELQNLQEELRELRAELQRAEMVADEKLITQLKGQIRHTTEAIGGEELGYSLSESKDGMFSSLSRHERQEQIEQIKLKVYDHFDRLSQPVPKERELRRTGTDG